MSTRTLTFALLGISLLGCSSSGSDGGGGGGAPATCSTDYAKITAGAPTISFKDDIMPIFGLSCVAGECHNVSEPRPRAGLVLGVKCKYDATAKWKCTFPTTAGADPIKDPQPLTQAIIDQVYANLMLTSKTVPGSGDAGVGGVKRVAPGDDVHSFLLDKIADIQNEQPYKAECQNQDTSKSTFPCGDKMPLTGTASLCVQDPDRFAAIAQWIAQGAKNN